MAEKTRYSDEELEEFRAIINEKLRLARRDFNSMMDQLRNTDGNGIEDTSPTYKALEEGSASQSKEEIAQMANRQQKFIQGLEAAFGACGEQDLWHRPHYWRTHSEGTSSRRTSCYT